MFKNKAILLLASALLALPGAIQAQGVTPTAAGKGNTVSADQLVARYQTLAGGAANARSLVNGLRTGEAITLNSEEKVCKAFQCAVFETIRTCTASTQSQTCVESSTAQKCVQTMGCPIGSPGCSPTGTKCVKFETVTTCTKYQTTTTCTAYEDKPTSTCKQYSTTCATWGTEAKSDTFSPGAPTPMGFGNVDIALALTEAKLGDAKTTPAASALRAALLEILGKRAAGDGWGKIANSYGFKLQE